MTKKPMVILEEDYERFREVLATLHRESNALLVFLLDKNGQQIAAHGEMDGVDPTSLASLAAGNIAATEGLGGVLGENRFQSLYHEGDKANVHLTSIHGKLILLVAFDEHSSLGLVRLRVEEAGDALVELVEKVTSQEQGESKTVRSGSASLNEITDEDIDALFG